MNTIWLKIAGAAVGIVVIVVLASNFLSEEVEKATEPDKGFSDQVQEDREKFLAPAEKVVDEAPSVEPAPPADANERVNPAEPVEQPTIEPTQQEPAQPKTLYFKPLGEIDKIEAERLLNAAVPGRSIGRLSVGFKQMTVDPCRNIIRRWPDTYYAYQARRILGDLPPRFQTRYDITEEETDVSKFSEQRPGTQPFTLNEGN